MLTIRQFRASDCDTVWLLHKAAVSDIEVTAPDSFFANLAQIEPNFLANGGEFLVAEYYGELVAMGGLKRTSGEGGEITRMRVHPDFQRRGFGKQVLRCLETQAVYLGCTRLYLHTSVEQLAAQAFYLRNGYREIARGKECGLDVVYFEKQFTAQG
jgi:ribosomal protein S18 acetylase RimI-like enzyme